MPTTTYIRNGHAIDIEVDEDGKGRWHWSFTVDGGYYTELRDRPLKTHGIALGEASHSANIVADRLPPGGLVDEV